MRLVECVPNFSEGRRQEVVERITAEIRAVRGTHLLDVSLDPDHNRAVVAFAGEPAQVAEAALAAVRRAAEVIDMNEHRGAHPRIGATDVVPFVPVLGVTMEECVALARDFGRSIGDQLGVPVYLYGEAASRPERRSLSGLRKGEFEGLREAIASDPARRPDFGPSRLGSAGATAVGARKPLIAYNVNLATADLTIAKDIARLVRESSGGLPAVQALGFELAGRGMVQVSMNFVDFRRTPPQVALKAVRRAAAARGVEVAGAELVGIVPAELLCVVGREALAVDDLPVGQVLESRLLEDL